MACPKSQNTDTISANEGKLTKHAHTYHMMIVIGQGLAKNQAQPSHEAIFVVRIR